MRTDPSREEEFAGEDQWGTDEMGIRLFEPATAEDGEGPPFRSTPFSGNERNRMFFNNGGNFDDLTLVSGTDFREDGRGFVLMDFDKDGWVDLGVVSPNAPRFRVVRNNIGKRRPNNSFVTLSLVGGQTSAEPSLEWSARDAIGATALVTIGDSKRKFQLACGEGLSSQNAKRIHIGMGEADKIDRIEITWPSGKKSEKNDVEAGSRLTIYENENAAGE